ncbi:MAG: hypothetical protein ACM65M_25415 [Microcoleus sp.]
MKIAVDGFDNFFSRSLCLSNYFNDAKGDRVLLERRQVCTAQPAWGVEKRDLVGWWRMVGDRENGHLEVK